VQPWVEKGLGLFGYERSLFAGNWFFVNWLVPPILTGYVSWAQFLVQVRAGLQHFAHCPHSSHNSPYTHCHMMACAGMRLRYILGGGTHVWRVCEDVFWKGWG
jgi:hypothetical protein